MKRVVLTTTVFFGLAASGAPAGAVPFDFTFTRSLVTFTVPTTAIYQILAFGAQGGSGNFGGTIGAGGRGAEIGGDFSLTAGEVLQIAVGGAGGSLGAGGGGGGGSFVVGPGDTPLVIAGGGGGGGAQIGRPLPGEGGLTIPNGTGNGGAGGMTIGGGGGGGGFLTGGEDGLGTVGTGGHPFPDLAGGIIGGGFGGGGGAAGGAGGGGGYSGGNGGGRGGLGVEPGGGGGSFDAGVNQILVADFRLGNGEVIITELPAAVPEPASLALLGAALASFATAWRPRRRC